MPSLPARQQRALSAHIQLGERAASKRAIARLRSALAELTEANLERVQELFDAVAADNPADALRLWLQMLEFSVPKLQRVEVQQADDASDVRELTMDVLQSIVREETARLAHERSEARALQEIVGIENQAEGRAEGPAPRAGDP